MSSKRLRLLLIGLLVLAACAPASPSALAQPQPGVVHVTTWDTDVGSRVYVYTMPDGVRCYSIHSELSCVGWSGYSAGVH